MKIWRVLGAEFDRLYMDKEEAETVASGFSGVVRELEVQDTKHSPGWPDPLQSPQAEAIRNGKIDWTDLLNLFDTMERELVMHREKSSTALPDGCCGYVDADGSCCCPPIESQTKETYYTKGKDADYFENLSDKDFVWALTCAGQDLNDSDENVSEWMPISALLSLAADRISDLSHQAPTERQGIEQAVEIAARAALKARIIGNLTIDDYIEFVAPIDAVELGVKLSAGPDGKPRYDGISDIRADEYDDVLLAILRPVVCAALASLNLPVREVWWDMSSAPKDGTFVDLWARRGRYYHDKWERYPNMWWADGLNVWRNGKGDIRLDPGHVSHWMPLPSAPLAAAKETGE